MKNRMKKICSVLLCMLTVMNLFVGAMLTVSAVTQITAVSISGVEVPRPGATPDYTVQGTGTYYPTYKFDGTYMKNGVAWLDVTDSNNIKSLKPTDTFVVGRKYRVSIVLEAHSDYEFAVSAGRINVAATVNGKSANTYDFNGMDIKRNIGVYYVFTCQNELITNVAANCVTPHEGQLKISLQNSASVDESRPYYVNGLLWTNLDSNGNTSYMKDSDKFTAGKSYRCEIYLRAKTGYVFNAANGDYFGNAKVNGKDAGYFVADMGDDPVIAMTLHYDITIPDPIKTVSVSGIDAPVAGKTADTSAVVDGTGYKITNIEWWDVTVMAERKKVTSFEAGRKYDVYVDLQTVDNYRFYCNEADYGVQDITGTINGKQATAYGSYSATEAAIGYAFYTPLEHVDITGITAPAIGAKPDMTAETADERCEVSSVLWYELDENGVAMLPALNAEYVFEEGKQYRVSVVVSAVAPYKFFCDPEDSNIQAVTATLNGKQAHVYSSYSWTKADVAYTFDKLTNAVVTPDDKLNFKADSTFTADHTAKIANITKETSASKVSEQIANEYFTVNAKTDAPFVGTGITVDVKDSKGKVLSTYTVLVKGDVNGDGKIETSDARLTLRAAVNLEKYEGVQKMAADFNSDGKVETSDARLVLRKSVGLD